MAHEWYFVKKPSVKKGSGGRQSFAILAACKINGKIVTRTLPSEELDLINKALRAGSLPLGSAEKEVYALKDRLYKQRDGEKGEVLFSEENARLFKAYWSEMYEGRDLIDPQSMYFDLQSSIGYLQGMSLRTASKKEMQSEINKALADKPNKQRRVVTRLNQLLKYAGRNFTLLMMREQREDIRFLTLEEFKLVVGMAQDPLERLLYWTAFGTGARLGECFSLSAISLNGRQLKIAKQMDGKNFNFRQTKTGKVRSAWVHPEALPYVTEWCQLPVETKKQYRTKGYADKLQLLSGQLFKREDKTICFHDLRHSYAVMLLQNGTPLNLVAQSLGNSSAVCEKYYTGFVISDLGLETIDRIMNPTTPTS